MVDFDDSVMIALLPTYSDWCKIKIPHMTLVYVGETKDLRPGSFNELAKDASSIAMLSGPITLRVTGVEVFGGGDEEKVDVLTLQASSELLAMRRTVESWNASEHPFNPHCTIGPAGSFLEFPPHVVSFDRISVHWGKEVITFWFRKP